MGERMTLEAVRDWHREKAREMDVCGELMFTGPNESPFYRYPSEASKEHDRIADALDAHLTQPAQAVDVERVAQLIAHRACCGTEHDPLNGKLHGYCVVCGVPWPCEYAGKPPAALPNANGKEG